VSQVPIVDAKTLPPGTTLETDLCIVGAGAAGCTLAAELAGSGQRICLLESGGFEPDPDTQALYDLDSVGYPQRPDFMSRARYFGGSCNLWAGRSMALAPLDLAPRPWVPGAAWPIDHDEIERFLDPAARVLGLPRRASTDASRLARLLTPDERLLLASPDVSPTVSLWAPRARRFGPRDGRRLAAHRNVNVVLHASAVGLRTADGGSHVESLAVRTPDGGEFGVRARTFVLACGGLETARLLLVSRDRHPDGLGNASGLLGRFFMDHPRTVFGRVTLRPGVQLRAFRGRPLPDGKFQVGVAFSPELQRREGLLNHYLTFEMQTSGYTQARYQSFVQTMKVLLKRGHAGSRLDFAKRHLGQLPEMIYLLSPKELMPHALYRLYVAARDSLPRRPAPQDYVLVYFCEQPPRADSRVTLADARDRLGSPKLVLDWRIDEAVHRSLEHMQALLGRRLQETGLGRLEPTAGPPAFTDASHHMGTTRMSRSPSDGVVDTDCRVHGIDNLFVASSAVFPGAGHANPTWTIVALALRLAAHLRARR
jgi:choline dehydrogenase-like flavoprotein